MKLENVNLFAIFRLSIIKTCTNFSLFWILCFYYFSGDAIKIAEIGAKLTLYRFIQHLDTTLTEISASYFLCSIHPLVSSTRTRKLYRSTDFITAHQRDFNAGIYEYWPFIDSNKCIFFISFCTIFFQSITFVREKQTAFASHHYLQFTFHVSHSISKKLKKNQLYKL